LPDWILTGGALWLVHPPARRLPRRVELLRDFLLAELRTSAPA
jgi:DNA-binding transcriptional LysR family regulator